MTKGRNIMNIWGVADNKGDAKGRDMSAEADNGIG